MENKICIVCKKRKSFEEFKKDNRKKDGRKTTCKECSKLQENTINTNDIEYVDKYKEITKKDDKLMFTEAEIKFLKELYKSLNMTNTLKNELKQNRKRKTFYINKELANQLNLYCSKTGSSISDLVNLAIYKFLNKKEA